MGYALVSITTTHPIIKLFVFLVWFGGIRRFVREWQTDTEGFWPSPVCFPMSYSTARSKVTDTRSTAGGTDNVKNFHRLS